MKKVYLLKGLPASGKSTWAKEKIKNNKGSFKRINKDLLREMLDASEWSKSNEKFILDVREFLILKSLEEGKHVIVDDTNLAFKHEERIKQLVKGKAQVEVKFFDVDVEECIKRDLTRINSVGEKVIRDMYNQFLRPEIKPVVYKPDTSKPKAIIFDIDGTLAKMCDRSPYDFKKCIEDDLNWPVYRLYLAYKKIPYRILLFSGRDEICRPETEAWLKLYKISADILLMRPEGNKECDTIIKERMFNKVKDNYNIQAVIDDRPRVVKHWKKLGLFVFNVDQNIEFKDF